MLHILLTFDYELFFNDMFCSEKEILIDSTDTIVKGLEEVDAKGTFFVDAACIYRYLELGMKNLPQMIDEQLNRMLDNNHDIQLHIHPSWFTAVYDGGQWRFNQRHYALDKHVNVSRLIIKSKKTLDDVVLKHPKYRCCAFRAGGFCLAPELTILETLYKIGIRIDSSVCGGMKMDSIAQSFDWTDISSIGQWGFDPLKGIRSLPSNNNFMLEIPIGTYSKIPQKWLLTHCHPKLLYPPFKGKPSPIEKEKREGKICAIYNRIQASFSTPILFAMDSLHSNALSRLTEYYINESLKKEDDLFICAIAHPKFSSQLSVNNMKDFITNIKRQYPDDVDFITMQEANNILFN